MEYQRILCSFLHHSPTHISQSTRQVLPALLAHCYNPEGLSRSIVATIAREITSLNDEMGYGLSVDEVQNYWFAITPDYQPGDPSAGHKHHQDPTAPNVSHTDARDGQGAFSHSSAIPHHPNPNVDLLLATAYNNVIFTWITDFLLYPTKKRADFLIPRHRTHPILRRRQESTARDDDSNVSQPSKKIHRLPRRTPPPTANTTIPDTTITADVHMEIEGEDNSGLDGCRIINDVTVEADHPLGHNHSAGLTNSDAAYAQWNGAQNDYNGEDWFGEALDLRMGKYREKLKQDLIRRDGPLCAASKQSLDTFCTQIIPESADPHRFFRFRRMVSVFFAGQYDHLLEPPPQSPSQSQLNTSNSAAMEVDHSLGSDPSQDNRRSKRRGHYPISENILRSSRNSINMSEKWMRWFDEGRFTIRERGGQFYIICLDPTLYHDPSFSRQGIHPNDPWESAHWLRLEVGATNTRQRNEVSNPPSRLAPIAHAGVQETLNNNSLPPLHSVTSAHLPQHNQNQHQLPTPTPTPTSPPPILSLPPLVEQSPLSRMSYTRTRMQTTDQSSGVPGIKSRPLTAPTAAGQMEYESERTRDEIGTKRSTPAISISSRLLKRTANRNSSPHPYDPKSNNRGSSRWQSHSELHNIRTQTHSHSRSTSSSSIYSLSSTSTSSSLSTQSTTTPSRHSIASLLNPKSSLLSQTSTIASQLNSQKTSSTIPPVRKELWDVDALDLNLVRLHEQIVTAWWATGLAPEVNTQMHWVDNLPLPEMNIVVLGQPGFTSVLKHKLTLL